MKFQSVLSLVLFLFSSAYADTGRTVSRTQADGLVLHVSFPVDVKRRECSDVEVYGLDPVCGYDQVCDWEVRDVKECRNGTCSYTPVRQWICNNYMRSCNHLENRCYDVSDHYTQVEANIHFDEQAALLSFENERLAVETSGTYANQTLSVRPVDSRFTYVNNSQSATLLNEREEFNFFLTTAKASKIDSSNNLEVTSAQFTDPTHFHMVIRDSLAGAAEITNTVIRISVRERDGLFRDTFLEGTYELSTLPKNEDGTYSLDVAAGSVQWKNKPDLEKGDRYMVYYSVQRSSPIHTNEFSKERGKLIKVE